MVWDNDIANLAAKLMSKYIKTIPEVQFRSNRSLTAKTLSGRETYRVDLGTDRIFTYKLNFWGDYVSPDDPSEKYDNNRMTMHGTAFDKIEDAKEYIELRKKNIRQCALSEAIRDKNKRFNADITRRCNLVQSLRTMTNERAAQHLQKVNSNKLKDFLFWALDRDHNLIIKIHNICIIGTNHKQLNHINDIDPSMIDETVAKYSKHLKQRDT